MFKSSVSATSLNYCQTLKGQHNSYVEALTTCLSEHLVSGSRDHTIKVWSFRNYNCEHTLVGHSDNVAFLTLCLDGRVASGSGDKTIKLWDLRSYRCEQTLVGHSLGVSALTVCSDGRLASGSRDGTIKVWDLRSYRCEQTFAEQNNFVDALTLCPNDRLASGSFKTIRLWDLRSYRCEQTLVGHSSSVSALTMCPDGRLASGSSDHTIKLWDLNSYRCEQTLTGHSFGVNVLIVSQDGGLVSGAEDNTIKLWDLHSHRCTQTLIGHSGKVRALTVCPDGRLASGSEDYTIKLWGLRGLPSTLNHLLTSPSGIPPLVVTLPPPQPILNDLLQKAKNYYQEANHLEAVKCYRELVIKGDTSAQEMVVVLENILNEPSSTVSVISAVAVKTSKVGQNDVEKYFKEVEGYYKKKEYKNTEECLKVSQFKELNIIILTLLSLNPLFNKLVSNSIYISHEPLSFKLSDQSCATAEKKSLIKKVILDCFVSTRPDLLALAKLICNSIHISNEPLSCKLWDLIPWVEENKSLLKNVILEWVTRRSSDLLALTNLIINLSQSPIKNVEAVKKLTEQNGLIGFYSSLISAHCHMIGTGVVSNHTEALRYLRKAITIAEKNPEITVDLTLPLNYLKSNFSLAIFEVCELYCLIVQIEATVNIPHFDIKIHTDLDKVKQFFQPKLSMVSEAIEKLSKDSAQYKDKKEKLLNYHRVINLHYFWNRLEAYKLILNERNNITDFLLNALYQMVCEDKDLENPLLNPGEFFDTLLFFCDVINELRGNIWATRFYQLHFSLSSSPECAMRLAEIALKGHLRLEDSDPMSANFVSAAVYYSHAVDEAIKECDIATAFRAIQAYEKIEPSVPRNKRLDLFGKLLNAYAKFKDIHRKKDQKLTFRIEHVIKRNNTQNNENFMEEGLIKFILQNFPDQDHRQQIKNTYLAHHQNSHTSWFKFIANTVTPDANQTVHPPNEILLITYKDMLPHIIDAIESVGANLNPAYVCDLVSYITKYKLHLIDCALNDQFFGAVNNAIGRTALDSVVHSDSAKLKALKSIYDHIAPAQLANRSRELIYWLGRIAFEITYNSNQTISSTVVTPLSEIYQLAFSQRNGLKPFFSSIRSTYLDQLKAKEHPEACLKVAHLIAVRLSPAYPDMAFMDIGVSVIKAMTCTYFPGDSLGIYTTLGFDLISEFKIRVKKEGYTDAQRSIVHFYYALALLIKDFALFHKDLMNLFEGKTYSITAKSALELLRNDNLLFDNKVKRYLLNQIVGLDALIASTAPGLLKDAVAMLQKLPAVTPLPAATAPPMEAPPPPFNPAALEAAASNVAKARVPIPVPAAPVVVAASDQIDGAVHSAAPISSPDLVNSAIQAELAALKLQYEKALALLGLKDSEIGSNNALLKEREVALGKSQAQLQQTQESLVEAEKKVARLEAKLSLFFQTNGPIVEPGKKLVAGSEVGSQLNP